jgi:osmoprotectant transport system ATP-binding protein
VIGLEHVSKRYPDGTVAVDDLTIDIASREITVLVGSSGCGKTTTLRMINKLIVPTSGTVAIDGRDVATIPNVELRRGIGYVIQQSGLFPHKRVIDNITTVPRLLGWDRKRSESRALELMELVGLPVAVARRFPAQLSGGQQQRVGVARALAADPPILLMDEPFGAVDPVFRGQLQREFLRLQRELHKTIVFVTHDVDEAVLLGDRIAILGTGGLVHQFAPPDEVLQRPADAYVAEFLGDDRGLKRLALISADVVTVRSVTDVDDFSVLAGEGGLGWANKRTGAVVPTQVVGPAGTLRSLLDAVVSSPAHAAVRVDGEGKVLGIVTFDDLISHLADPGRSVSR